MDYQLDKKELERLEQQHVSVQDQIKKLPEKAQQIIKDQQAMVDTEIDRFNKQYFDFSIDRFLIMHDLPGNCREDFLEKCKAHRGKSFIYNTNKGYRAFHVGHDGKIMFTEDYIYVLEKAIISKDNNLQNTLFTKLSIIDIVKLTFKKLTGGLDG